MGEARRTAARQFSVALVELRELAGPPMAVLAECGRAVNPAAQERKKKESPSSP